MWRAILYAYVLGGLTFIPLLIGVVIFITLYTSVPVGDSDVTKNTRRRLEADNVDEEDDGAQEGNEPPLETNDIPRTRKGWLTMRRTFEESSADGSYVTLVRSFLDARSKDPKKSRPKDMWYVALKGKVLYLYEDEDMTECGAAIHLSGYQVVISPENLPDAELFAKRNAICLKPRDLMPDGMPSVTKEMRMKKEETETEGEPRKEREAQLDAQKEAEKKAEAAREEAFDPSTPWFIFVRSNTEMEDWYMSLIHASEQPSQTPTLAPLRAIFEPADMNYLVSTLDEQPDVIPMRWLNALLGRIFFSQYRTHHLEAYIIGRLMKKLSKVKRPAFLTEVVVTQVSVGNRAPMLSKPMLKELTKEGDASIEVHLLYKGEIRITVEATAVINLGARFKSYTVKLVLAAVLKELEGNLLVKVKRPPSNRIWYAFTQTPRMVLEVEPIVSDRQITWGMILSTIESKFKEIIQESVVMPNMDDIAFFDTEDYEHRGGIWPDAARKPQQTREPASTEQADDAQSVSSAPVPETTAKSDVQPPLMSKSATDVPISTTPPITETRSVDVSKDDSSAEGSSNPRRRTWFGAGPADEAASLAVPPADDVVGDRGRTLDVYETNPSVPISGRAASTHSTSSAPLLDDASTPQPYQKSRRSSSQHSIKAHTPAHDEDGEEEEETNIVKPRSTPNTPRRVSDASQIARPSSPPSFFSTLKSKAADKEALSKTAKETMRKWGVNWGGFKKDSTSSQSADDSSGSQPGSSPPHNDTLHKARASYAEVKAAVKERKEREESPQPQLRRLSTTESSSTVADKLARLRPALPNGSIYSDPPTNPAVVTSSARLTTPKLAGKKSNPSIGLVNTDVDLDHPPQETSQPIHVQPQAKTMSIPGIHASHRGEIQSMGYVAPQPSTSSSSSGEGVLKNPALQTVYRLWKNPQNAPQDSSEGESEGRNSRDITETLPHLPNSPPPLSAFKPTPPPLPPRSTPVTTTAGSNSNDSSELSSASQALKAIAQKDDDLNRSFGSSESDAEPTVETRDTVSIQESRNEDIPAFISDKRPSLDSHASSFSSHPTPGTPPPLPPRGVKIPA